jgi:hypothetical protein
MGKIPAGILELLRLPVQIGGNALNLNILVYICGHFKKDQRQNTLSFQDKPRCKKITISPIV